MRRAGLFIVLFLSSLCWSLAQTSDTVYKQFFYPNGALASEGFFYKDNPFGEWKTYYPDSTLKSVGIRKQGLTDSLWIFFDELGDTIQQVNYRKGLKDGFLYRYYFIPEAPNPLKSITFYQQDKRENLAYAFNEEGDTLSVIPFFNDMKHGVARAYRDGELYLLRFFRKDTLLKTERVNNTNNNGERSGTWVKFHENGSIARRNQYKNGLLHDKQYVYNEQGEVVDQAVYNKGNYQPYSTDLFTLDVTIRKMYDVDSNLIFRGVYKDSLPVGMHRWYDSTGTLSKVRIYNTEGKAIGEGLISKSGDRVGDWVLFNSEGNIKARGKYADNLRIGTWNFYYKTGALFQEGNYYQGAPEGDWVWYYPNQTVRCKESFLYGQHDGKYVEYDSLNNVIVEGNYVQGKKEGKWKELVGDFIRKGKYVYGQKEGEWKYFYADDKLYFKGGYFQGSPNGTHRYFYPNGKLKEIRHYNNGRRIKNWVRFTPQGDLLLVLTFENNKVVRINGKKTDIPYE
ncbi:MAG TPA: hypothetical protein VJ951_15585 [Bacteroidales bacterium]|nr:hypothetical protein [Bacteroidales bacterium]